VAKPRLIPLLLATTVGGMALSAGWPLDLTRLLCTLLGGAMASAGAGVLNCLWEEELDGRMARTSHRAIPSGRLAHRQAFALAIGLTLGAVVVLVWGVNPLAAALSLLGLCSYVLLYTALAFLVAVCPCARVDTGPLLGSLPAVAGGLPVRRNSHAARGARGGANGERYWSL